MGVRVENRMVGTVGVPFALDLVRSPACFCCMSKLPLLLCYETVAGPLLVAFKNELLLCNGQKKKDALADFVVTKSL